MIRTQRYSIKVKKKVLDNMKSPTLWILTLTIVVLSLGTAGVALSEGDTLPVPAEGWWKALKGGETAIFEIVTSSKPIEGIPVDPVKRKMVTTIKKVDGSNITFSIQVFKREKEEMKNTHTIDVANHPRYTEGRLPPPFIARKLNDTIVEAGGQRYNCTIYEIQVKTEVASDKSTWWISPRLPPIFNGGRVKTLTEDRWGRTEGILKSYKGGFL